MPKLIECGIISETTQSVCHFDNTWGMVFWAAGQRVDPTTGSTFVWRISTDTCDDTLSVMRYTNWVPGEPNNSSGREACMLLSSGYSYKWNDGTCNSKLCSVCEIDIMRS